MKKVTAKSYPRSARLYEEARKYLPGGVSSNFRLGMRPFPLFFERANGSKLYDTDGNEFVDYALGMGPVILGHGALAVNRAVEESLKRGQLYAGQHEAEVMLAHEICDVVPCAEMVRFSLSGSEAIQAAIRLARAFTGRSKIIKFEGHYHGWFDNIFVSVQPEEPSISAGTPSNSVAESAGQDPNAYAETETLPWNDIETFRRAMERHEGHIAAVIMEPVMCNSAVILPRSGYLEQVRELCTQHGVVLIFDEVITGFRVGLGGAQEFLGVIPDLAVFAKALANGFPMSCLAGRRNVMELFASRRVMHGGTFNTNIVSCAAALATLRELREDGARIYSHLRDLGTRLMEGLKQIGTETCRPLHVQGLPSVFHTSFTDQRQIDDYRGYRRCQLDLQGEFVALLLDRGVRITGRGTWFLSAAHSGQDVEFTLDAARAALLSL